MTILTVSDLSISLAGKSVLHHVAMRIHSGEVVGLLGPNGAGKTTLIKVLAGLSVAGSEIDGEVYLDNNPLRALSPRERARHIAYLPQQHDGMSLWPVRVRDLVALGRLPYSNTSRYHYLYNRTLAIDSIAVTNALRATDTEILADCRLDELSGGERARVLLARALAVEAQILLADEPIVHLDPKHQIQLLVLLRKQAALNTAVLVVLHDLGLIARYCDKVAVLDRGSIVVFGSPMEVLDDSLLEQVYSIRVIRGSRQGTPFLLPWEVTVL